MLLGATITESDRVSSNLPLSSVPFVFRFSLGPTNPKDYKSIGLQLRCKDVKGPR